MADETGRGAKRARVWVAGGGTGGHLFPGLAVAAELKRRRPELDVEFIGGHRGIEQRLVPQAGFPLRTLRMTGLKGRGVAARIGALWNAAGAALRCFGWTLSLRPALLIGVGGYASGPAMLAGLVARKPTLVLEQNHFPGATNRLLARWVRRICLPSEAARQRLGGVGQVTGNPVRPEFFEIPPLQPGGVAPSATPPQLLVFGGSRGARSINEAMIRCVNALTAAAVPPRLVLQTGEADRERVAAAFADYPAPCEVLPFLDDMPRRLAQADLVICRAGATTLSELAAAGRPAVLVPYPYAADDHQRHNAEAVRDAGGAVVLLDQELEGDRLAGAIHDLLDDPHRRLEMGQSARELARPDALKAIADIAESMLPARSVRTQTGGGDVS